MGDDGGLPGFSVFDRQSLMRPEAGSFIRRSAS